MATANTPRTDSTLRLRDGRALGYMEVGRKDGVPIFHFHGNPSSRQEVLLIASQAASLGVRLIGLDRPGIGRSDARPGFEMLDWPDDVMEAADQLGIERFAILGFSGGGPFALACAYKIPHRLIACGLVSSVPPIPFIKEAGSRRMRTTYRILERIPSRLFRSLVGLSMRRMASSSEADIEKNFVRNGARLGEADQKLLDTPQIRRIFAQAVVESYRQGVDANLEETMRLARRWGLQIEAITFEQIFLWHGEQDRIMPVAPARLLAERCPQCVATFYPDTGHLSTLVNHARDILNRLCT